MVEVFLKVCNCLLIRYGGSIFYKGAQILRSTLIHGWGEEAGAS
jgi:hypothetical protein